MTLPPLGVCLPCRLVGFRDGDTVVVSSLTGAHWAIRLINCWAPDRGEPGYDESNAHAEELLAASSQLHVYVPAPEDVYKIVQSGGGVNLLKAVTFDRVLGWLFLAPDLTLNEAMVVAGHAGRSKKDLATMLAQRTP